jgi:lysine 6-dehydrogenase
LSHLLLAGFGMQGQAALHDLAQCGLFSRITVADHRPDLERLVRRYPVSLVTAIRLDAADDSQMARLVGSASVVVEALPATLVLRTGQLAAEAGVPLVSSMFYFNPEGLDDAAITAQQAAIGQVDRLAREKKIPILTEFGLDPGLDLLIAARAVSEFDEVHVFRTYGAGLPAAEARGNPLQYKFSWSPIGVMRAYHRNATVVRGGRTETIPAVEIFETRHGHTIDVESIGTLECFPNGDAARYAKLLGIGGALQESGRYTCRYPGHCAFWNVAAKSGFLDTEPVRAGAIEIAPAAFTAALLSGQPQFQYEASERDLAFIRVEARGIAGGRRLRAIYDLIDYRDLTSGFTAMQRTVGFTLSRGAQLIASGRLKKAGLLTPLDIPYDDVMPALEQHGIRVQVRREEWQ